MPRFLSAPLVSPLALVLLAPLAAPAVAQQRTGGDGRALDANSQLGSGGVNARNSQIDFGARNLLITGQVTAGRQFRGGSGIQAEGAFRGFLGSDDLFRFRADSAGLGNIGGGAGGVRGVGPGTSTSGLGGANIIFNDFFVPSAGGPASGQRTVVSPDGTTTEQIGAGARIYNPGLLGVGLPDATRNGTLERDDARELRRRTGGVDTLGRFEAPDGRALQVDASPLFGIQQSEIQRRSGDEREQADEPASGLDSRRTTGSAPTPLPGSDARDLRVGAEDGARPRSGPGASTVQRRNLAPRLDAGGRDTSGRLAREEPRRLPGDTDAADASGTAERPGGFARGGVPLAVQLGSPLNPVLRGGGAAGAARGSDDAGAPTRLEQLRAQIFRPLEEDEQKEGGAEAEGSDPYLDLLRRLRDGDAVEAAPRPAWMRDLTEVPAEVVETAEERRRRTMEQLLSNLRSSGNEVNAAEGDAVSEEARSVANQLGYEGPRLETLRSQRKTRTNENLANAEAALSEGRYFDAEGLYRQVVADAADQPLARVGLVHAQMAAGMHRSSALTLRRLFNDHPELISVRYAESLLPPAERMTWLRNELQRLIEDPQSPRAEGALMLAYLGWQVESRELVRYGLALAEEARPTDPLFSLLRVTWLDQPAAGARPGDADAPANPAPTLEGK